MKIQIDTDKKTIKVLENVKLGKLINLLKNLLGKDYEEYLLESGEIQYIYWQNPIYIPTTWPYWGTGDPFWPTFTTTNGIYNIETQDTVGSIKS
jgi:hypothetical protein